MLSPRFMIHAFVGGLAGALALPAAFVPAQEATPAASMADTACDVEPRDIEEIVGFFFGPEGTPLATPEVSTVTSRTELPPGDPVDAATEEAVNMAVTELFACFNAGQFARAFGLMTDDMARQMGPDTSNPDEDTPEEVAALLEAQLAGTPVVDEAGMADMAPIDVGVGEEIRVLEGGRVGGVWTIEGDAAFVVFEQEDGFWLVDEVVDIVEDEAASTPAS